MCIRNILAALIGAIVVMAWLTVSWLFLPFHSIDVKNFKDNGHVMTEAIKRTAPESGLYTLPYMSPDLYQSEEKQAEWTQKAKEGPYVFMSVKSEGMPWDMHMAMIGQFIIVLFVALGVACLMSKNTVSGLFKRAILIAFSVTLGVVLIETGHWNWWGFPIRTIGINIADAFIGWFLGGIVMSLIMKKSRTN
ncbi:MAG: hypothetical protein U1E78_11245 [Gammaproteobacteria bacterium]